jgi:hypothetical protein
MSQAWLRAHPARANVAWCARESCFACFARFVLHTFVLQDIFQHPWFCKDLHPEVLAFNDAMVKESLANLPSPEMLEEVRVRVTGIC